MKSYYLKDKKQRECVKPGGFLTAKNGRLTISRGTSQTNQT